MSKVSQKIALFGLLGLFCLSGFAAAQIKFADGTRPTGLKPLDAAQLMKIRENWPRIDRIHLNPLGFERINAHRAKKGSAALAPGLVRPLGREVEGAIAGPGISLQASAFDPLVLENLPPVVDNSLAAFFPPITDQGYLNSCLAFASTYYQLSYMSALLREPQTLVAYSPKWTYNMTNEGIDGGQDEFFATYYLLEMHGAATWAEFPYDEDFRAWSLDPAVWRNALSARTRLTQYVNGTDTEAGIGQLKALLNNGYVPVFGTYIMSWQGQIIMDDPATTDDDLEAGKGMGYFVNGTDGSHAMTIVGYNDAIWADVNGNLAVDPGEKGAFKIANSWGTEWQDDGFVWLAYDALRAVSAVPGGPSEGRVPAFQANWAVVLTPRQDYSPSMIAQFTVNTSNRSALYMRLSYSEISETEPDPRYEWLPGAISAQGGEYAFDGTTTAIDGTFVFDLTDLVTTGARRYWLGIGDNGIGATLSAFKIVDLTTDPETETACTNVPQYAEGVLLYVPVDYTFSGEIANRAPAIQAATVDPPGGTTASGFIFSAWYRDQDGDAPTTHVVYIDDVPHELVLDYRYPASDGPYSSLIYGLSVGVHSYRYFFEDGRGASASEPPGGTFTGPVVTLAHFVTVPGEPQGDVIAVAGTSHAYATSGGNCNLDHPLQYRFDWGDGTYSSWLTVGQSSASHSWSAPGAYAVKAQARCSVEPAIVSPWSGQMTVTVPRGIPFTESFASSGFPQGWIQQKIGLESYNAWILANTGFAGGDPFEMRCEFEDVVPGTSRLISPPINTLGHSTLRLRFKHFLDAWETGGAQLLVQTSPDGATWTDEAWSVITTETDIGPETVDVVLTNNLNSATTYVAFVISGDLYMFDYWYVDDVELTRERGSEDLLATWDGQGVYYRNSDTGAWVKLASPATMIACGDMDEDGIDDVMGLWPTQGGIWVKYSASGAWAKLSSTAVHIAGGDMNGDGRDDLLGTWDGQGAYYRNSATGAWIKLASPATLITTGDIDGDGTDDLVGIWPTQGGIWVKYSSTGAWAKLSSSATDFASGDMNGDGRDDLLATYPGQGVYYRDSLSGAWIKMASEATQVTCGDLDADGKSDLIGIWPTQGGVWVKYSKTGAWAKISSTARDITSGVMRLNGGAGLSAAGEAALTVPVGGAEEEPTLASAKDDLSDTAPGGRGFKGSETKNLEPRESARGAALRRIPGPGEPGFKAVQQPNLVPGKETDRKQGKPKIAK
jgi:hypothetical protein